METESEPVREVEVDPCVAALLDGLADVEVEAEQETLELRGNVLASGDDEEDRKAEQAVADALDRGNVWAWASVRVVASFDGFEGDDFLGACSYDSEADFRTPGGYFDDMRAQAVDALAERLKSSGHYGEPGSVSTGTLLPGELVDTFASTAEGILDVRRKAEEVDADAVRDADRLLGAIRARQEVEGYDEGEEVEHDLAALFDLLDGFALPGYTFGAHEGDGADFGFWAC